jgi:uncharacterized protein (TIGR02118 family)
MIKLTVLYGHPDDPEKFEKYYLDTHTPIALKIKGMRRFEIAKAASAIDGSKPDYFRLADIYFDDLAQLQAALTSPEGQAAAADLANFATGGVKMIISPVQTLVS